ncbi:tail fiber protein [uncultured Tenacibaculum sp.]|uniref:phage tail protein n=1 Tax=uncultured Tenacibaculum sp. TaxID=174713 RepID=UPI00262B3D7E|nr:tail fiber protein [uncultured Tenacibaculum sp.]
MNLKTKLFGGILLVFLSISNINAQQEGFLGEVKMFAGNFAPRGWAFCEGQLLPISQNTALFSILGTMYGGDGRTTFGLPDLRGRIPMGMGNGPGLTRRNVQGQKFGGEYNILNNAQLPSHSHIATVTGNQSHVLLSKVDAVRETPQQGDVPAVVNFPGSLGAQRVKAYGPPAEVVNGQAVGTSTVTIGNTGTNAQVNNIQPSITIRYIICTQGLFPSRN